MTVLVHYETKYPQEQEFTPMEKPCPITLRPHQPNLTAANIFHDIFMACFGRALEYRIIRVEPIS